MEFVAQLWAYKSEKFYLGVRCSDLVKNHVWLLLILLKTVLVGASVTHMLRPDVFSPVFDGIDLM